MAGDGLGRIAGIVHEAYSGETLLGWDAAGTPIDLGWTNEDGRLSLNEVVGGPQGFLVDEVFRHTLFAPGGSVEHVEVAWPLNRWTYFERTYRAGYLTADDGEGGLVVAGTGPILDQDNAYGLFAAHIGADGSVEGPWSVVTWRYEPVPELRPDIGTVLNGLALGRDGEGNVLVLWRGAIGCSPEVVAARWFRASGPVGPAFVAFSGIGLRSVWLRTIRLLDGSLVAGAEEIGFRRFAGGVPAAGPPPRWIADRQLLRGDLGGWPVGKASGGRALVIARQNPEPDSAGRHLLEFLLVSPGGLVCARFDPAAPSDHEGTFKQAAVGYDGTLVQAITSRCAGDGPLAEERCCTYRWWPGLLR